MCRRVNPALFHAPLISLTIHRSSVWSTLDEMFGALSSLPSLVVFDFDTLGYSATDFETFLSTINTPRRSVLLSRLRTLKLAAQLECVGLIMNRLVLSTTTAIAVDGRFFRPPSLGVEFNTMLDDLDDGFESHLGDLQEGYRRLSLGEYKNRAYKGFNLTAHAHERNDHAAEPPIFQYGATYHDFDIDHVRGYIAMLSRIVCWPGLGSAIVRLEVAKRRLLDRTWQWGHILEDLPNLEEVVIEGPAGRAFVSALRYPADAPRCPRLQSVVLRETKLMSKFVDRLIDHLIEQRVPHGCPLLQLSFSECSISIADVERLRQTQGVADGLSWDGEETGWESWRMKWAFQGMHHNPADEYESDSSDGYMPSILEHFE
ncbi:hypothetical protein PENSPDRAFT_647058 [Peniophora sp. CONT]|nr:hypothetical protein PENSPDRAFT_647058 [Peniophora sp. CONT]